MAKSTSSIIRDLGFPNTKAFQSAWNLGPALVVDGVIGKYTTAAANESWERHRGGSADLSAHFSAREFRCHCGGTLAGCQGVLVNRLLLVSLEALRDIAYPRGLTITSGYRCPKHNAVVQGATGSQHMYGRAADIPGRLSVEALRARRLFGGLGYRKSDRLVVHVDRRDIVQGSRWSRSVPAQWPYEQW